MKNIVILDGYTANPGDLSWDGLSNLGTLTVYDRTPAGETVSRIGSAEIVLTNKTVIDRGVMEACPSLAYIGVLATGYNVVDVPAAAARGITVTNIPAYSTPSVAQATIALLLEICNRVAAHSDAVHAGRWASCPDFCFWDYPLIELAGKTMGIVGYGKTGQATARIARALGMNILAYSRSCSTPLDSADGRYVPLSELLALSDVVSLHCPLTPETEHLINADTIAGMKDGAILINNSRGPVIDEQAVAHALHTGKLYAAGVDVASVEPVSPYNPLLSAKNCFITPHISWAPKESRARLVEIAVKNVECFLSGKPVNVVH